MLHRFMTRYITRFNGWRALRGCVAGLALAGWVRGEDLQGEPWSVSPAAPVFAAAPAVNPGSAPVSVSRTVCFIWLSFYQHVLHVVIISHCPMYPSCSNYSIAAINQYGAWRGIVLTADRLLHEADEGKHAVVLQIGSRQCYFDPVENNDFLWRK